MFLTATVHYSLNTGWTMHTYDIIQNIGTDSFSSCVDDDSDYLVPDFPWTLPGNACISNAMLTINVSHNTGDMWSYYDTRIR